MTSKERFLAAAHHTTPDRVPINICLTHAAAKPLAAKLGVSVGRPLADKLGCDFAYIGPDFRRRASRTAYADPTVEVTPEGYLVDIWGVPFRTAQTQFQQYVEPAGHPPLADLESVEQLDDYPWPSLDDWDFSGLDERLDAERDMVTWSHSRGMFEIAHFMRGMEGFLTDLALRPELAGALMDRICEALLTKARRTLELGQGRFVMFEYNDDVATQRGLIVSPGMWREHIKPRMAAFCELFHSHGALVRYHCCGSCYAIIDDLIDIGVDILNPVQPLATNMDPLALKAQFGDRLSFDGGIDIQQLLPNASADEVREHTRRVCDVVGAGGGYIMGGSHYIQGDTPPENILAMVEAVTGRTPTA